MNNAPLLDPDLQEELRSLDWFVHAGDSQQHPEDAPLVEVGAVFLNRKEMVQAYAALPWQRAINQAGNRISGFLSVHHNRAYPSTWNDVAHAAGRFFDQELLQLFAGYRETFNLSQAFVVWNRAAIIGMFHAQYYRPLGVDTAFDDLVRLAYRAGRYPCSWVAEEWPNGKLAVW